MANLAEPFDPDLAAIEHELERSLLVDSLRDFVEWAWPLVTGRAYVANRVTTPIVDALQRVADGEIGRLIVNKPPGCGASTLLVAFQAWRIARDPAWRTMAASHSYELSATASRRVRRLVESPEFRKLFPIQLRDDANQVAMWETVNGGHFIAVGRDSNVTGRRVNELVIDDLAAAGDKYSKAALDHAWHFFAETLSTRVDNDRSAMIVCGQRIDVGDVSGRLIEQGGWTIVSVPAEDADGPTAPNVLPAERLAAIKAQIGATAFACQYNQAPTSDEGAIIKRGWWRFYRRGDVPSIAPRPAGCDEKTPVAPMPEHFERVVLACDLTFGSATGDFNAVQAWGAHRGGRYLLESWRARGGFEDAVAVITAMARRYPGCAVLIEKAANGAAVIETLRTKIAGVRPLRPQGSKQARLSAAAPSVESGACYLPLGWDGLALFVEELAGATKFDDQADAAAYAIVELATADDLGDAPVSGWLVGESAPPSPVRASTHGWSHAGSGSTEELERDRFLGDGESR